MAKYLLSVAVLLALAGVTSASTIDNGPGGQMYMYGHYEWNSSKPYRVRSFPLTPDWKPRESWSAPALKLHGNYTYMGDLDPASGALHPEILTSSPTGYAEMIQARVNAGAVELHKYALNNGGNTDTFLGTIPNLTNANWLVTDWQQGLFTGSKTNVFVQGFVGAAVSQYIVDTSGNVVTTLGTGTAFPQNPGDVDIAHNRLYGLVGGGNGSIRYYEKTGASYSGLQTFFTGSATTGSLLAGNWYGLAADMVSVGGVEVPTVWVPSQDSKLWVLRDLDGDGSADEGETNEVTQINYGDGDHFDTYGNMFYTSDVELIRDPETGKRFILMADHSWAGGVFVLQILDNGDYKAGSFTIIGGWDMCTAAAQYGFELDFAQPSAPIPEPCTMLLIGTGALSVAGYLRRRRLT